MGVGFVKDDGMRRVRFRTSMSHDGVDYDAEDEATIDVRSANTYSRQCRAEILPNQPLITTEDGPKKTAPPKK